MSDMTETGVATKAEEEAAEITSPHTEAEGEVTDPDLTMNLLEVIRLLRGHRCEAMTKRWTNFSNLPREEATEMPETTADRDTEITDDFFYYLAGDDQVFHRRLFN